MGKSKRNFAHPKQDIEPRKFLFTRIEHPWSLPQGALAISIILNLVLASACIRGAELQPGRPTDDTQVPGSLPPEWTSISSPEQSATSPAASETAAPFTPTAAIGPGTSATPRSPLTASVSIGLSFIGGPTGDNFYFHVSILDEASGVIPETIQVVDPVSGEGVGGPFLLSEKDSEFCYEKLHETEGVDPSELPSDFWYQFNVEPFFIYRVVVRVPSGEKETVEIDQPPGICRSESQ